MIMGPAVWYVCPTSRDSRSIPVNGLPVPVLSNMLLMKQELTSTGTKR